MWSIAILSTAQRTIWNIEHIFCLISTFPLIIIYFSSPVNKWGECQSGNHKKHLVRGKKNGRKWKIFCKCSDKIREELKGQRKRISSWCLNALTWKQCIVGSLGLGETTGAEGQRRESLCGATMHAQIHTNTHTCTSSIHQILRRAIHIQPTLYTSPRYYLLLT